MAPEILSEAANGNHVIYLRVIVLTELSSEADCEYPLDMSFCIDNILLFIYT